MAIDDYDPTAPEVMNDPFAAYARMREACPVHRFEGLENPFYTFFRYDDVRAAQMNPAIWSSRYGSGPSFMKSIGLFADGPAHAEFRNIFKPRLSPAALMKREDEIREIAARLVDDMLAKGSPVDLHDALALPLPVTVIARFLGVPDADLDQLKDWSDRLTELGFGQNAQAYLETYAGVCSFFDRYLDAREAALADADISAPGAEHVGSLLPDDWISDAVCARYQGRRLRRDEQHIILMGLLVGGNETTTSLLTNCVWRLLEQPERWAAVKADPDALVETALEESLRRDPPTLGMFRTSLETTQAHGVEMPAKSKLMLCYGAANHDPDVFENPDEFRLDRPPGELRKHMAFGVGPHTCPGAPLARLEARIALRLLVEQLDDPRLDGPTERIGAYNFWGRKSLPIAWG